MSFVKGLIGVYMFVLGIAVAVHIILSPLLYPDPTETPIAWQIMDPMDAVAAVLALVLSLIWKFKHDRRRAESGEKGDIREYIGLNVLVYVSAVVSILYWIEVVTLNFAGSDPSPQLSLWYVVDATLVPLLITVSVRLFREIGWKIWP